MKINLAPDILLADLPRLKERFLHGGSYNSDLSNHPGPLGNNTETRHRKFSSIIGEETGGILDTLSSVTAPVVFGANGAAYVGIRTSVIAARDRP